MKKINLFIVGAAKSGTTTLHEFLDQHKEVSMSLVKEPNFFCENIEAKPFDYVRPEFGKKYQYKVIRDYEVYESIFLENTDIKYFGEASPSYLWDSQAASKIFKYNPDSRIIIVLRNPIKRAYSHFLMDVKYGKYGNLKRVSFKDILLKEVESKSGKWFRDSLYLEAGLYYQQITRYYNFFPEKNILLLKMEEDLSQEILSEKLCSFLDINISDFKELPRLNEGGQLINPLYLKLTDYGYNPLSLFFKKQIQKFVPAVVKRQIRAFFSSELDSNVYPNDAIEFLKSFYSKDLKFLKDKYGVDYL